MSAILEIAITACAEAAEGGKDDNAAGIKSCVPSSASFMTPTGPIAHRSIMSPANAAAPPPSRVNTDDDNDVPHPEQGTMWRVARNAAELRGTRFRGRRRRTSVRASTLETQG